MRKIVYSSIEHQTIVDPFINLCKQFAQEVSSKSKYQNFIEVYDTIIDYHNGYGEQKLGDFYNWIMIIPINLSVMTNGFFAGVENKRNLAAIRAYKVVLSEMLHDTAEKLDKLEPEND